MTSAAKYYLSVLGQLWEGGLQRHSLDISVVWPTTRIIIAIKDQTTTTISSTILTDI